MIKKIIPAVLLCMLFVNAQEVEQSLEDKYNACSESYDMCLGKCEESNSNIEECSSQCEEKFYNCNAKVDEEASKEESSQN